MINLVENNKVYIVWGHGMYRYESDMPFIVPDYAEILEVYDSEEKAIKCVKQLAIQERKNDPCATKLINTLDKNRSCQVIFGDKYAMAYGYKVFEMK